MSWNNILLKGPGPTDWILKLDLRSIDSQREINEKPIWRLINPFTSSHSVQSSMINLDPRRRFKASTILSNEKLGFNASKRNELLSNVRSLPKCQMKWSCKYCCSQVKISCYSFLATSIKKWIILSRNLWQNWKFWVSFVRSQLWIGECLL